MKSFFRTYSKHIIVFGVICLVLVGIRFFPRGKILENYSFSKSFFASDGSLLRMTVSHDDKYRLFLPIEEIPLSLQKAVLMYEDRQFYLHFGVNPYAVLRAFWTTFLSKDRRIGASTITMQTARILYDINSKNIWGKIKQMFYAVWLEMRYSKKDILEAYLNIAPYGYNIEGVGAASLIYFQKRLADTNLLEQMTLAVIPQNPNQRRPSTPNGFERMKQARNPLFQKWLQKYPDDQDKATFFDFPMQIATPADLPFHTPQFIHYLDQRTTSNEVFTTIDLELQRQYEQQISDYLLKNASKGFKNAVAMLVDTQSMQAQVLVGSADFNDVSIQGQVNGIRAKRMAGSILKSFIYGLALDQGLIHPHTLLKDTPQYFSVYAPENSDRQFSGPVLAVDALVNSRNIPAISLMERIGADTFLDTLSKGGVSHLKNAKHYGASAAIGSIDVTVEEVAKIYAALASYGKITDIKYTQEPQEQREKGELLSPEASFVLCEMLTHNPLPDHLTVYDQQGQKVKVAWKTGTSCSFKDAWAAGIFGHYVLVVWVGNFSGEGNPHFWGRTAAGRLFTELIRLTVQAKPDESFAPAMTADALNVKQVPICVPTGDLPGKYCPYTKQGYFILGKSPIKISDIHRPVLIDNETGLRACYAQEGKTHEEIYEFWPSDILSLFEQAGIQKKTPPKYVPGCEIEDTLMGKPPDIILPVKDVLYYVTEDDPHIPLKANTDADGNAVFWFIDDNYVGKSKRNETIFAKVINGNHTVRAVDDLGRYKTSTFQVRFR